MKLYTLASLLLLPLCSFAQQNTTDTSKLEEVVIRAFEGNRRLREIPAAVGVVGRQVLNCFPPFNVVAAVNTIPGVRMEERSPGSYRFNIRGSSLRSPFGVRNVKVYYNDIPITDPGGQTYLNNLGFYNFASLEIIKGPGSSLYGAGTGGVMLIEGLEARPQQGLTGSITGGSFGQLLAYGARTWASENSASQVSLQRQRSDGFRDHSALKRDVLSWTGRFDVGGTGQLKTTFLYSDLFYETPGALTEAEFMARPRSARPAGGGFPSAESARASVRQQTFIAGASLSQPISASLTGRLVLYGMFTDLQNPAIRNYGAVRDPHVGGRSQLAWQRSIGRARLQLLGGLEWQEGFSDAAVYQNRNGERDSLQTLDDILNRQQFLFTQATLDWPGWTLIAGVSLNQNRLRFTRFSPNSLGTQSRTFNNGLAPRVSLLRKLASVNLYASVSKGFSPPTTNELLPTGSAINLNLEAEAGNNYELGIKGGKNGWNFDLSAFLFRLENTIVQRRDAGGGEFFINGGSTNQKGIEASLSRDIGLRGEQRRGNLWLTYTYQQFNYRAFRQGNSDFSGNKLPGVAPHTLTSGIDFRFFSKLHGAITYFFSDRIPLNDANSAYADSYHLLGFRLRFQVISSNAIAARLEAGAENLLNETYSLGNDINAFGGRYYNAAPPRNYFASLTMQWLGKRRK